MTQQLDSSILLLLLVELGERSLYLYILTSCPPSNELHHQGISERKKTATAFVPDLATVT